MRETYWISLGRKASGRPGTYAQSIIHLPQWVDSAMRDDSVVGMVRVEVDLKTGAACATLEKNTI
jgi:hypothetical protein